MKEDLFLKRYETLNKKQKEAVDTIEGPVMVIAGPGTGKTTVLTLRIAHILRKTDTPPDGILALTFTESAVTSMRKKLVALIGPAAYRVGIYTFHGFAEEVIRKFPESFPRIIGGAVATEAEKLSIIESIIETGDFDLIRPFGSPLHYVRSALHTISDLKRDAVTPEKFIDVLKKEETSILEKEDLKHAKGAYAGEIKSLYKDALKNIKKNKELGEVYELYEKELNNKRLYDFDDMLLELIHALENEDLLQSLREEYLYFLADEHQDANNAQNTILEGLASYFDEPNLFIVGDEKQAIYRFQGASLENFLYFKNKFPTAKLIYLDENYRSHQDILDVSHALAESLPGDKALRPRLLSKGDTQKGSIEIVVYQNDTDEGFGLTELVRTALADGIDPEDIAVLVRTNKEITSVGSYLSSAGIPVTLFQDEDVLSDPDVAKLLLLLRSINDPTDETLLAEALFIDFLDNDPVWVMGLIARARKEKVPLLESLREEKELFKTISGWITLAKNASALDVLTTILSESHFSDHLLKQSNSLEKMSLLSTLYREISSRQTNKRDMKLKDFLLDIDTLKEHGARLTFGSRLPKEHTVSVMTAHRSKGLEWRMVLIPHVVSGNWGSKRSLLGFRLPYPLGSAHQSGKEEDERRLFYVALTRAKERVVVSCASLGEDGKELVPSQFIEEIPNELISFRKGEGVGEEATLLGALSSKRSHERTMWDKEYLIEAFLEQGLSATSLNNYIECPWKFFFKNLVRIPEMKEKHLMYGTAIHAALAQATNLRRQKKPVSIDILLDVYTAALDKEPLSDKEYKETLEKGKKVLQTFWKVEGVTWPEDALSEFSIPGVTVPMATGENILLRGRIDRMDFVNEEQVSVIDFKTGRAKSRNEILGATKSSGGEIKRQLDFYRLLLDLFDNGKYRMIEGTVVFTEPDEKERIRKETFSITSEDAENIREEIVRVAGEILNLSFWDTECSDPQCEFCALKRMLIER